VSRGRRRLALGLAAYAAALSLSFAWRARQPRVDGATRSLPLAVVAGSRHLDQSTELGFELVPAREGKTGATPVLLIHGSPGSGREMAGLAALLSESRAALVPDLPGFGRSRARLPDYSFVAHADYLIQLLDALTIERVHLVGFSMGGGVAMVMADRLDDRVASLTLLASIGAQEYELFGDYHLNRAIHSLQLAGLWSLHNLVPHFGLLDHSALDVGYARNFFDSDQRPLRALLSRLRMPVLILHGEADPLVPMALAHEHHRLLPQSELVLYPDDHFTTFRNPEQLIPALDDFLERVDRGQASSRADSTQERRRAAAAPFDLADLPRAAGLTLVLWMLLLAAATLVSEDLTCIATGLLVAQGRIGLAAGVLACGIGIFVGDIGLYVVGRWLGRPWLRRAPFKWFVSSGRLQQAARWFERHGAVVIFLSRFWPGMRLPTYVAAGLLRTRFAKFSALFALAVALWTPVLVGGTAWLGDRWLSWLGAARHSVGWIVLSALGLAWLLATLRQLANYRTRRLWLGRWRRRLRWGYWPPWLFYAPVVAWIGWLMLRYRGATVFTAANPSIPEGGFVGESKGDILDALPPAAVAPYLRLPATSGLGVRRRAVTDFLDEASLELPLVVKPDIGQRGEGVIIAHSEQTLEQALSEPENLIVQGYVDGPEFGVFYVRHPSHEHGEIFSITRKDLPEVIGDGTRTVEQLILADSNLLAMAELYLARLERPMSDVLEAGEKVSLVELGTHCRGAVFSDGCEHATPELVSRIEEISQFYRGFYFGRYDIKAPSVEDFRAGRGLCVLELNGVTSEATHIYDSSYTLPAAYRVLRRQWRLAFEIGAANRARGAKPVPLRRLIGLALRHLRGR